MHVARILIAFLFGRETQIDLALNSSFDTYWVCDLEWVTCLETCFPHLYNGANGTYFTEVL